MGFVTIEDLQGTVELVLFNRVWKEVASWLTTDSIVLAEGRIDRERGEPKVLVDKITKNLKHVPSGAYAVNIPYTDVSIDRADPELDPSSTPASIYIEPALEQGASPTQDPVHVSAPEPETRPETKAPASHKHTPSVSESSLGELSESPPPIVPSRFEDKEESSVQGLIGDEDPESLEGIRKVIEERPGLPASEDLMTPSVFESTEPAESQVVIIILRSTGDRRRDTLRMRRVHGLLTSYPGNDRFTFHVFESSRRYHLEFPSSTTGYGPELHAQLHALLGEGAVRVEPLRIQ
jgi:DNA polymerase-3 subunit alpha